MHAHTHATVHTRRPEDNFQELALLFYDLGLGNGLSMGRGRLLAELPLRLHLVIWIYQVKMLPK